MALSRIGQSQIIQSMTEKSEAARKCNLFFEQCRDAVLSDFPWPFATKFQALADIGSPPTNWSYRYRYPQDCLMARRIVVPGIRNPAEKLEIPYQIAYAEDGRVILTDQPEAELEYTVQVTDTGFFDPIFVSALAYKVATEIAMPLANKPDIAQSMANAYLAELSRAEARAFNEGMDDQDPLNEFAQCYNRGSEQVFR